MYDVVMANKQKIIYETKYPLPYGDKYFMVHVVPISNEDEITGICISSSEITKMKELENMQERTIQDLTERNSDLYQFSQMVSHNIRGPLSAIMGLTNAIVNYDEEDADMKFIVEGLVTSSNKLENVIKDLNEILQIRNETSENKTMIDLASVVNEVKYSLSHLADTCKAQISYDFSMADSVYSIRPYIGSIFYNLISNGIKYAKNDVAPQILMRTERYETGIIIIISDNGSGIDLCKNKDRIFNPYQRFNWTVEGKGLGLYMVKTLVAILNGTVSIDSTPGVGTTLKITLPEQVHEAVG
jgi:signal transduction histidine kinase